MLRPTIETAKMFFSKEVQRLMVVLDDVPKMKAFLEQFVKLSKLNGVIWMGEGGGNGIFK